MLLKKIIKSSLKKFQGIDIKNLSLDSRLVKKGDLFFALKGNKFNGEKFISSAIKKGALAVVCSNRFKSKNLKIPFIKVKDVKKTLSKACKNFFKKKPKNIIAVTGTNGKSSVADFFYQILSLNNIPVASIGTLGVKKNKKTKKIDLTSPDIISLHRELNLIKKEGINNVIIEASSHGLAQSRLDCINFKAGIFTNFSQDHLDFHISMNNYFSSKMILFRKLLDKKKYLITDSDIKEFSLLKNIAKKRKIKILTINKKIIIPQISLIGSFQKKNFDMAVLAAKLCGIKNKKISSIVKKIKSVNGRLELVRSLKNDSKVFIDYAHTPDALLKAINALKDHYQSSVVLVFGCGGQRDKEKRSLMAKIANKHCTKIYVTDDNPRYENPKKIRTAIIKNLDKNKYIEIGNRKKAIEQSIKNSNPFDLILIAGKGHENFQNYGKKIINFSDKKIVKKLKIKKLNFEKKSFNYFWNSKIMSKIINKDYGFEGVSINSKEIKKNNLFIAIKGTKNDGHKYLSSAINKGAKYCVTSKKPSGKNKKKLIFTNNTKYFLKKLALTKRNYSYSKIIAVTGSSGKTTLKECLGKLLNSHQNTYCSPKSYNNHFGVPLSLANLERNHKYGVFEIGMSRPGEIHSLSKIVRPNIAVITNIAEAHIENFKNIKGIANAKAEIINNIIKGGTIIINKDDNFFNFLSKKAKQKKIQVISFGFSKKSDVFPIHINKNKNYIFIKIKVIDETVTLKTKDINIYNILSSLAVLKSLKLNLTKIVKVFKSIESVQGRGKIYVVKRFNKNFNLVDESYNSNPLSASNAILNLSKIKKVNFKKYLLLGDMLELGKKSYLFHKNLSKIINNTDIDKIFVYGDKILNTYRHINKKKQGNILQYTNDFDCIFSKIIKKNDYLMIKGSNTTGLKFVAKKIISGANHVI